MPTAPATNESITRLQDAGFELYQERRPAGLVGRFLITLGQLMALACGGGYAFVRQKKADGQGFSLGVLMLRFILFFTWPFLNKQIIAQPFPVQFRLRLQQLGPTYIKLGQILSMREDLLPKSITDELKNLLDRLPAVPYERLKELISEDLQRPLGEMFAWIDPVPLGSASLGQTHRARLVSNEKVVLKVLKPGVPRMIEVDTRLLRFFGWFLQKFLSRYNPARLINEFSTYTRREVDLRFEADNAETFAANFKNEPDIQFPVIYREYSNRNVLCMSYFQGTKPDARAAEIFTQTQKEKVIELGIRAIIEMIFRDGFFHADLHPGNMVIFDDASVGFIDLGMVGQFDSQMRKRMFYYFFSLVMGDSSSAARYLGLPGDPGKGHGCRRLSQVGGRSVLALAAQSRLCAELHGAGHLAIDPAGRSLPHRVPRRDHPDGEVAGHGGRHGQHARSRAEHPRCIAQARSEHSQEAVQPAQCAERHHPGAAGDGGYPQRQPADHQRRTEILRNQP